MQTLSAVVETGIWSGAVLTSQVTCPCPCPFVKNFGEVCRLCLYQTCHGPCPWICPSPDPCLCLCCGAACPVLCLCPCCHPCCAPFHARALYHGSLSSPCLYACLILDRCALSAACPCWSQLLSAPLKGKELTPAYVRDPCTRQLQTVFKTTHCQARTNPNPHSWAQTTL